MKILDRQGLRTPILLDIPDDELEWLVHRILNTLPNPLPNL
jgi:hypothetical protein